MLSKGIYIVGLVFTLSAFYVNFARYFRHESTLSHRKSEKIFLKIVEENYKQSYFFIKKVSKIFGLRDYDQAKRQQIVPFPIIIICMNNMHDPEKIKRFYPFINQTAMDFLYGQDSATN